jgi:hypothetical protein
MKRVMTGLAVVATSLIATGVFAGSANADPVRPPGVPASYVYYKDIPSGYGECYSAGVYFEQEGLIEAFVCDQIEAPSASSGGDSELWALLP